METLIRILAVFVLVAADGFFVASYTPSPAEEPGEQEAA